MLDHKEAMKDTATESHKRDDDDYKVARHSAKKLKRTEVGMPAGSAHIDSGTIAAQKDSLLPEKNPDYTQYGTFKRLGR